MTKQSAVPDARELRLTCPICKSGIAIFVDAPSAAAGEIIACPYCKSEAQLRVAVDGSYALVPPPDVS